MNQQVLEFLAEGLLVFAMSLAFVVVLAASYHDIIYAKNKKRLSARHRKPPHVTVLIYAWNSAEYIRHTLDALRRDRYPMYDVVVVNDRSSDDTTGVVGRYIKKYVSMPIRLYTKRRRTNRLDSLKNGYRVSKKGDLILVIEASNATPPKFMRKVVDQFMRGDGNEALEFDRFSTESDTIVSVYIRVLQLSKRQIQKFYSMVPMYRIRLTSEVSIYGRSAFLRALRGHGVKGKYDASLSLSSDMRKSPLFSLVPQSDFLWLAVAAGLVFLLQTYSMYIAAVLQVNFLLVAGWSIVIVWLLGAVFAAESASVADRLEMLAAAPIMYFVLYIHSAFYIARFLANRTYKLLRVIR